MIDSSVNQILSVFRESWGPKLNSIATFSLDDSWPSIGTIDYLTFGLRLQQQLPKEAEPIVKGSAAYIGSFVASCWSKIADDCKVTTTEDGICVKASGGEFLSEEMTFPVEKVLRECLREVPDPFPVLRGIDRRIVFETNIVSLMTLGACMGISPFVTGPWEEKTFDELRTPIQHIFKELAHQTANYYSRCFPDEPLGSVAELYLSSLIFPPLLVGEDLPAVVAIRQLAEFAKAYAVKPEQINKLAANWIRFPDETISSVGLIAYAATCSGEIAPHVSAYAHANARSIGLLRHGLHEARALFTPETYTHDWVVEGIHDSTDEQRFELEGSLELIPWLTLPKEYFKKDGDHSKLKPFLLAVCAFSLEDATIRLDAVLEMEPGNLDLRLQRVKLDMLAGDWEKCQTGIRNLLAEDKADSSPLLFHLWSMVALSTDDNSSAIKYCKAGLAVCDESNPLFGDLSNNLGWAYLIDNQIEEALQHFLSAANTMTPPTTPLLNAAHVLWRMGNHQEAGRLRKRLLEISSNDRRVFSSIAAEDTSNNEMSQTAADKETE